ncbi:MAG: hypothetical protein KTR35_05810 [Gammaproteobacteria bacterium]|nr:hypothetical protein [Gammaproteobacteria bacterium]
MGSVILLMSCASYSGSGGNSGAILTDDQGMTLYTFDRDPAEQSACNGTCAAKWPPYLRGSEDRTADGLSLIKRDDGTEQWAINGKALYRWAADTKPGDRTGDNVGGVWHVVPLDGDSSIKAY